MFIKYNPQNDYYHLFLSKISFGSSRRFFYALKAYVIEDSYQNRSFSESSVSQIHFKLAGGFRAIGFRVINVLQGQVLSRRCSFSMAISIKTELFHLVGKFDGLLVGSPSVRLSVCRSVCLSVNIYHWHLWAQLLWKLLFIFLKLCWCFMRYMQMCMWFVL